MTSNLILVYFNYLIIFQFNSTIFLFTIPVNILGTAFLLIILNTLPDGPKISKKNPIKEENIAIKQRRIMMRIETAISGVTQRDAKNKKQKTKIIHSLKLKICYFKILFGLDYNMVKIEKCIK